MPDLITTKQLAEMLKRKPRTVSRMAQESRLPKPVVNAGKRGQMWSKTEIELFLAGRWP